MVNPFTHEVFPDQWCQGNRQTDMTNAQSSKGVILVSRALWCDAGNHAFSSLDLDMEEGTRTRKAKNRYGDIENVTVEYHVCGQHVQRFPSEITDGTETKTE